MAFTLGMLSSAFTARPSSFGSTRPKLGHLLGVAGLMLGYELRKDPDLRLKAPEVAIQRSQLIGDQLPTLLSGGESLLFALKQVEQRLQGLRGQVEAAGHR